ncbi:MAG: hypothetical protein K0U98_24920 [Deltaproteobacteria bacterium]|nr:hypothetical protein [Deltaproteobacteria bacterium]
MVITVTDWLVDESKWFFVSLVVASVLTTLVLAHQRRRGLGPDLLVPWALNLFYGCTIGTMAFGHILAVTIKLFQGTLDASPVMTVLLYGIGFALAIPAGSLVASTWRFPKDEPRAQHQGMVFNLWLGATLLVLGLHNFVLAVPALFNIAYRFHTRRAVGWGIVTVAGVAYAGLLVGSLIFLASGQSFEQFSGME